MQKVKSSDESLRVDRSTKLEPKPPNHIDYGARVVRNLGPVQVQHIFPFHYCVALGRPDLELDERNLITLCGKSHDGIGENQFHPRSLAQLRHSHAAGQRDVWSARP